jgi:hypothetical protein
MIISNEETLGNKHVVSDVAPPVGSFFILLEDGTSRILLQDGVDKLLKEDG